MTHTINATAKQVLSIFALNSIEIASLPIAAVVAFFTSPAELSSTWKLAAVLATATVTSYGTKAGKHLGKKIAEFARIQYLSAKHLPPSRSNSHIQSLPLTDVQKTWHLNKINADGHLNKINADGLIQKQMQTTLKVMVAGAMAGFVAGGVATFKVAHPFINVFAADQMHQYESKRVSDPRTSNTYIVPSPQ